MNKYLNIWLLLLLTVAVVAGETPPAPVLRIMNPPAGGGVYVAEFRLDAVKRIIVRENDKLVPFQILGGGREFPWRVAFSCQNPGKVAFFGITDNVPGDAPATADWRRKRGLLLTTWPLPAGARARNLAEMRALLARCEKNPSFGSGFVPNVYHAYNPFGPANAFVSRYDGWIDCPQTGEYVFATSSDDASFLLVDDREIVSWPGRHGPVWDTRHQKKTHLAKGPHRFEYFHVNFDNNTIACAAWKTPGGKKIEPIPASAFGTCPPVLREIIHRDGTPLVIAENDGIMWSATPPLLRYRFSLSNGQNARWDYGDGNHGKQPAHLYLQQKSYPVTAVYKDAAGREQRCRATVQIAMNWQGLEKITAIPLNQAARQVAKYDFSTLDLTTAGNAIELLLDAEDLALNGKKPNPDAAHLYEEALLAATGVYLAHPSPTGGAELQRARKFFLLNAEMLRKNRATMDKALHAYRQELAKENLDDAWRANVTREYADTLFYYRKNLPAALDQYDTIVGRYTGKLKTDTVRIAQIKIGDIHWLAGRTEAALRAYQAAEKLRVSAYSAAQDTVRKGALYKAVDDYLRRREYPAAAEWLDILEWEYPLEKIDGFAAVARARLALATGKPEEAEKQLRNITAAGRKNAYTATALKMLREFYLSAGRTADAEKAHRLLRRDFPEEIFATPPADKTKK